MAAWITHVNARAIDKSGVRKALQSPFFSGGAQVREAEEERER